MDTYIEVIGHAEVAETVVEQRATLTVTVKASKAEVAFDEATLGRLIEGHLGF